MAIIRRNILIMRFIVAMLSIMPLCVFTGGHAQENPHATTFFSVLNDVPVMPGYAEVAEEALTFDKPEGRIIKAAAVAPATVAASETVLAFYKNTLPQLGWQMEKEGVFVREQERLTLNIHIKEGVSVLRLWIEPR